MREYKNIKQARDLANETMDGMNIRLHLVKRDSPTEEWERKTSHKQVHGCALALCTFDELYKDVVVE